MSTVVAQEDSMKIPRDSTFRGALQPPAGRIDSFRALPDYQYDRPAAEHPSLWDMIVRWFQRTFLRPLDRAVSSRPGEYVLLALAALAILWALVKVLRSGLSSPFERRDQGDTTVSELLEVEDIQAVDLHALLNAARAEGRLRDIVRFRFLLALQTLEKAEFLAWSKEKTNRDFVREVRRKDSDLGRDFSRVTRAFEYVWYGNVSLSTARLERIESDFQSLDRQIGASAG